MLDDNGSEVVIGRTTGVVADEKVPIWVNEIKQTKFMIYI